MTADDYTEIQASSHRFSAADKVLWCGILDVVVLRKFLGNTLLLQNLKVGRRNFRPWEASQNKPKLFQIRNDLLGPLNTRKAAHLQSPQFATTMLVGDTWCQARWTRSRVRLASATQELGSNCCSCNTGTRSPKWQTSQVIESSYPHQPKQMLRQTTPRADSWLSNSFVWPTHIPNISEAPEDCCSKSVCRNASSIAASSLPRTLAQLLILKPQRPTSRVDSLQAHPQHGYCWHLHPSTRFCVYV